jgi:DNA modification methylase
MKTLTKMLKSHFEGRNYNIFACDVPGEGEHKLFELMRTSQFDINDKHVVYGLDSDLIMLSMLHLDIAPNIFLYRETPEYIKNINPLLDETQTYILNVKLLSDIITKELGENIKYFADLHGFKQPRVCQWVKTNPVPINSKRNYLSNAIEFFFTFVKGKNPTFNSSYDKGIYNFPLCHGNERTEHPTQKPLGLIKALIEKHSNVDDLVLDPFGGSGTTAIASIELSRDFILFEKDQLYFELSKNRIEQIKK